MYEEARLRITPLIPPATYWADADQLEGELTPIRWEHEAEREHTPLLVISACREGQSGLSLMFLAEADGLPTPSSEIHGLLLLDPDNIQCICQEPLTLGEYLRRGGQAVLNGEFDKSLVLEPFAQLRLLARILGGL